MTPGGIRKGAGRPPKAPADKRRHRVVVYLTDAEVAVLLAWQGTGETPNGVARRVLVATMDEWNRS